MFSLDSEVTQCVTVEAEHWYSIFARAPRTIAQSCFVCRATPDYWTRTECLETVLSRWSTVERRIKSIAARFKSMKKDSDAREIAQGLLKNTIGVVDKFRELYCQLLPQLAAIEVSVASHISSWFTTHKTTGCGLNSLMTSSAYVSPSLRRELPHRKKRLWFKHMVLGEDRPANIFDAAKTRFL